MEELLRFTVEELPRVSIPIRQYDNASLQQHVSTSPLENITASLFPCLKKNDGANKRRIITLCITLKTSGINWHQSGTEWHRYGFFRPFPSP